MTRRVGLLLAVLVLSVQGAGVYAVTFSPVCAPALHHEAEESGNKIEGPFRVGLYHTSWSLDDGSGSSISTTGKLFTAEYRLNDKFALGGWYNTSDIDANLSEINATMSLSPTFAIQLGLLNLSGGGDSESGLSFMALLNQRATTKGLTFFEGAGFWRMSNIGLDSDVHAQFLVGASMPISSRVNLEASYWRPLSDSNRISIGLSGRF